MISDPQSSGLSSLKGSAKPGGVRLTPDGFAVVPLQLATEGSYCKKKFRIYHPPQVLLNPSVVESEDC